MKLTSPHFILLTLFIGLTTLLATHTTPVQADPPLPTGLEGNPTWANVPGTRISTTSANGSSQPHITANSTGNNVLIVYNHESGDNTRDPYYSLSGNNGSTWSTPAPIHTSPGVDSVQANAIYDTSNTAHTVWIEAAPGSFTLSYARQDQWGTPPTTISTALITIADPQIIATDDALHIIWAQKNLPSEPVDIFHAISTDNGDNWTTTGFIGVNEPGTALAPDVAVDDSGDLHVVWEEAIASPPSAEVRYAHGTIAGTTATWSSPIPIAAPPTVSEAREPSIAVDESAIHVAFTNKQTVGVDVLQWSYYTSCTTPCTTPGAWNPLLSISGTSLTVNGLNPFFLIPSLAVSENCTYVYFHGVNPGDDNELIWGVNSCDGWSASARDQVTTESMRAIFPSIINVGEEIFLAYEWVNPDAPTPPNQIYFMRGDLSEDPVILMPIIQRR